MRQKHSTGVGLEALESRQLLAGDIGIWLTEDTLPEFLVPGLRVEVEAALCNLDAENISGTATVRFYASHDEALDENDTLLGSVRRSVRLGVEESTEFTSRLVMPQGLTPGHYYLIAQVEFGGDPDEESNIAVSEEPIPVILAFGTGEGFRMPMLSFRLSDGTQVTARINGPGLGVFGGTEGEGLLLAIEGTSSRTVVTITTARGSNLLVLDSVEIDGSIRSFAARTTRVEGVMEISGGAGDITLAGLFHGGLSIGAGSSPVRLSIGTIKDSVIESGSGIASFTGLSWLNEEEEEDDDAIEAPWLGSLNFRGHFQADMELDGEGAPRGLVLGTVMIGGAASGDWEIGGAFGTLIAGSILDLWFEAEGAGRSISVTRGDADAAFLIGGGLNSCDIRGRFTGLFASDGALNVFKAGALGGEGEDDVAVVTANGAIRSMTVAGSVMNSILAAVGFNSISIGGNLADSVLVTGTYLGQDADLGQSDPSDPTQSDEFGPGYINSLNIRGSMTGSLIAAGIRVNPDGDEEEFELEELEFVEGQSLIRSISVGHSMDENCIFLARQIPQKVRAGAVMIATAEDPRFITEL